MSLEEIVWRVIPADMRDPGIIVAMDEVLQDFVGRRLSPPTLVLHHWKPSISIARPQDVSDI
ncbi:MAG: hypothetical protein AABW87_04025, partial [Nanoarchaeota archaeon]